MNDLFIPLSLSCTFGFSQHGKGKTEPMDAPLSHPFPHRTNEFNSAAMASTLYFTTPQRIF
ncbi:hypothetical protein GS8_718 [Geobacillus stearothermophilus]|uniref:Uncharacterized protein n=1 Tax=Geobacillus stearothermophilus TaxID=1422 RepID=A0A150N8H5_GEOSE|nr:hypothetical protein GS8_718 [Geobacillus stearothermophilus]KYD32956.1 hypothetical protein B4114_3112 [Geobacillus stearothermophilus]